MITTIAVTKIFKISPLLVDQLLFEQILVTRRRHEGAKVVADRVNISARGADGHAVLQHRNAVMRRRERTRKGMRPRQLGLSSSNTRKRGSRLRLHAGQAHQIFNRTGVSGSFVDDLILLERVGIVGFRVDSEAHGLIHF